MILNGIPKAIEEGAPFNIEWNAID